MKIIEIKWYVANALWHMIYSSRFLVLMT